MRLGIRWKLILAIGMPLAALSAVSLAVSFEGQKAEALSRMRDYLSMEARYYASWYDSKLDMAAQIARTMASYLDEHPDIGEAELYRMLERNVEQSPLIYGSCVAFEPGMLPGGTPEGKRLMAPYVYRGVGTPMGQAGPDGGGLLRMDVADAYDYTEAKWEWYQEPRRTGRPAWTEPFFDDGAGDVIMCTQVAPFFAKGPDGSKRFRGTVNIDVRLVDLQTLAAEIATELKAGGHSRQVGIISRRGTFVSWDDPELIMKETVGSVAERMGRGDLVAIADRMVKGETGTAELKDFSTDLPIMVSFAPIPSTGWSLTTAAPQEEIMAPVLLELRDRGLVAAGMIVVVVGVVLGIGVWLTRPLERLAAAVRGIGVGRLEGPPVEGLAQDEIGELARAFNTMVRQLREQVAALTAQTKARESVESELRIAREIQRSLLPRTFPPFPHRKEFELHAYNGAARRVAGDFYDFFFLPDGRLALVIGDVCGKGVPAALFMAVARTVVRNLAMSGRSPDELLTEANGILLADNTQGLFVTLIVAFYDPATGAVTYGNGGHPRPLVVGNGSASCRTFGRVTGTIVGALENQAWGSALESLSPGEAVVMFTDGVPDARRPGGPLFGEERLAELLAELAGEPVDRLCQRVVARLDEYAASDWPDDVTLLVLRRIA